MVWHWTHNQVWLKTNIFFIHHFSILTLQDMVDEQGRVHRLLTVLINREQVWGFNLCINCLMIILILFRLRNTLTCSGASATRGHHLVKPAQELLLLPLDVSWNTRWWCWVVVKDMKYIMTIIIMICWWFPTWSDLNKEFEVPPYSQSVTLGSQVGDYQHCQHIHHFWK